MNTLYLPVWLSYRFRSGAIVLDYVDGASIIIRILPSEREMQEGDCQSDGVRQT